MALVFAALNTLFTSYIVLGLRTGRIPSMAGPSTPQAVFYLAVNPLTAGVVEELVWRGYLIGGLFATGRTETRAILLSSVSFASVHGFFLIDKLLVTTIIGAIAGLYYV